MRTIFLTTLGLMLGAMVWGQTAHVNWMSLEEALAAQKKEPRKIMMDVYTQWCGPCKRMMATTFTDANVVNYLNEHYYAVKFDAESPDPVSFQDKTYTNLGYNPNMVGRNSTHELSRALGVSAYPTLVYLDEKAKVIAPISGMRSPGQLELFLRFFHESYTPDVQQEQWEAYQKSFTPTW